MAEAFELNFLQKGEGEKFSPQVQETLLDITQQPSRIQLEDDVPESYRIETYYRGDDLGADVLKNKYLAPGESSPWHMWKRLARAIASVEKKKSLRETWEKRFFQILEDFKFVPGGRIMHGAGREDITTTLNNCYVVGIKEDSINAIYEAIRNEAMTYKFGGGCGHDLSILRPSGSPINGTGGVSCGPTGFMNLFSENTNTIAQHGRRGANMQTIRVDHPDVEKFIQIKTGDVNMVKYSNISVLLTHEFMEAVEQNKDFELRWGGQVYKTVRARDLWDLIIHHAHASAEPGLLFWDTMKEYHNAEYVSPLLSTNPCAEQPLPDGGCCNLGAINLERFVDDKGVFMIDQFKETARIATRFLDNVVDYNLERHALPIQKENARNDRRVGCGILGLGDMLVKMGIRYDSESALQTVDQVMQIFRDTIYETSVQLAIEKGPFPNFDWKGYSKSKFVKNLPKTLREEIQKHGIRNATLTTVAPTGSGAIVARVTSGIEPIFATSYTRRVKQNEGYGKSFREYKVFHPIVAKLFGDDSNLPDYVVTAHKIDPYFRVKMQGVIQKYIDSSISSTVNLPEDTPKETVADIYMTAYKAGLKGITVYREGSREGILVTDKKKQAAQEKRASSTPATSSATQVTPTPRKRPSITRGITRRMRTGDGTLYITINEDDDGLCEVFTAIGKAGGNAAAQSEAISRLISLALRSRINPKEIVKQLKGISGPNPSWEEGRLILSTPDAIGKALDDYLKEKQAAQDPARPRSAKISFADEPVKPLPHVSTNNDAVCSEGDPLTCSNVVNEGGCLYCRQCGWSKCE
ncbi:MAG: adenosylcobalamin-dependent ribonucleoside-diphosphate reductase [Candidatus Neomarinimicrobiota bacterium]|nr:MAG: adenosylcobalamin-dependent ribonucleoside-diphosphate reductase [Candidatus Neomarinimicrobiota bacterium]